MCNNSPACSVVTTTAMLYGPIPTTVLAAILHTYVVKGCSESRVGLVDVVVSWNISPVAITVTLTTQPTITPFWSDTSGGFHAREMEVEEVAVPVGLVAGALGTTEREKQELLN